jgi:hypothetical protein
VTGHGRNKEPYYLYFLFRGKRLATTLCHHACGFTLWTVMSFQARERHSPTGSKMEDGKKGGKKWKFRQLFGTSKSANATASGPHLPQSANAHVAASEVGTSTIPHSTRQSKHGASPPKTENGELVIELWLNFSSIYSAQRAYQNARSR